jgi:heat-inducible transcriptional repressor
VFRHIEFLRLGERRVLVILVSPDGDVQNRVIFTAEDYTSRNWSRPPTTSTAHYSGLTIEEMRERLKPRSTQLRGEIAP